MTSLWRVDTAAYFDPILGSVQRKSEGSRKKKKPSGIRMAETILNMTCERLAIAEKVSVRVHLFHLFLYSSQLWERRLCTQHIQPWRQAILPIHTQITEVLPNSRLEVLHTPLHT